MSALNDSPFEPPVPEPVKVTIELDTTSPHHLNQWALTIGGRFIDWYPDPGAAQRAAERRGR